MNSNPSETDPPAQQASAGEDWWAMGELLSLGVDQVVAPIEGMHRAIAHRWLGLAGPSAETVRRSYDTVTKTVYGSVRVAASAIGAILPFGVAAIERARTSPPTQRSRVRGGLRATANAVWGDELERRNSRLAIEMGFYDSDGRPLDLVPTSLAAGFPDAGNRLVVLIHGLGETEDCWQGRTDGPEPQLSEMLTADSLSPILLRYNTGRHVSRNGDDLTELLERLLDAWPVEIEDVALVGQSMGGLVARSALDSGISAGHVWASKTRHVVTLGTPHLGSPLEKGANLVAWGLGFTPESRPLGEFLRRRSSGIKDLRFGTTSEEDWVDIDPDALLAEAVEDVAPRDGVQQHFVAGVVTQSSAHPIGAMVGDLVVRVGSATGQGRRRRVAATDILVLGRQRHFDLATDPTVHGQIRDWLTG